jgi:hypothetical protein
MDFPFVSVAKSVCRTGGHYIAKESVAIKKNKKLSKTPRKVTHFAKKHPFLAKSRRNLGKK